MTANLWRTQIRRASWRGYPFQVESHSSPTGRRIQSTQFPYRDVPATEDLGRKQREYQITAYVIGDDYHRQRDNLIEASEKEGPGILVHPVYGVLNVRCTECTPRETRVDARMCVLDFTFVEAGETGEKASRLEQAAMATAKALDAADAAADKFLTAWNMEGAPSYILAMAEDTVATVGGWMAGLANPASGTGSLAALRNLADNAATLATSPGDIATDIISGMGAVFGPADANSPERTVEKLTAMLAYGDNTGGQNDGTVIGSSPYIPEVSTATESGASMVEAQQALQVLVQAAALSQLAQIAQDIEYEYIEQGEAVRDALTDGIDALCENTAVSDELYVALQDLRAAIVVALPVNVGKLPSLQSIRLPEELPAIVLAWRMYGPSGLEERETEIVSRNAIAHPAFLPLGTDLGVLSV